jgi:hypothetical protein
VAAHLKSIPNITVRRRCTECGHEQDVESAAAFEDEQGLRRGYFGSAYDFCDKCDGPLVTVQSTPAKNLRICEEKGPDEPG